MLCGTLPRTPQINIIYAVYQCVKMLIKHLGSKDISLNYFYLDTQTWILWYNTVIEMCILWYDTIIQMVDISV